MEFLTTYTFLHPFGPRLCALPLCSRQLSSVRARPSLRRCRHVLRTNLRKVRYQQGGQELIIPEYITPSTESSSSAAPGANPSLLLPDSLGNTLYVEKEAQVQAPAARNVSLVKASEYARKKGDGRKEHAKILAEVMSIAIPAIGTVLADPLMSLVDTACVGQISAIQLAALGPNTAIFNFIFIAFSFMGSALANVLASNSLKTPGLAPEEMEARREYNESMLSHSLLLAVGIGVMMTVFLYVIGPSLLRLMGTSATVMPAALQYLLIRALASPAVLFIAVSQGACLGQQDMWTPMKVVATAGVLNLVGDVFLIIFCKMGTLGAAAATAAAQIIGALYFFRYLRRKNQSVQKYNDPVLRLKWKGLPTKITLQPLIDMGRVLIFRNMVLMLSFTTMTAIATSMGTLTLAAHQVTLQLFWFLSLIPEPLSLSAQSLIARDKNDKVKIRNLAYVLMKFGCGSGLALAATFGLMLTFMARFFSSDLSVVMEFQKIVPHGMISLFFCSISIMVDGMCIALRQIEHLPGIIYMSTAATLSFLWLSQRHQLGLGGVWSSMIIFFFCRCALQALYLLKNWQLTPFGEALVPSKAFQAPYPA